MSVISPVSQNSLGIGGSGSNGSSLLNRVEDADDLVKAINNGRVSDEDAKDLLEEVSRRIKLDLGTKTLPIEDLHRIKKALILQQ